MSKIIGLLGLSLLIGGCDPYRFAIKSNEIFDARIFSDYHTVNKLAGGFHMKDHSVVGLQVLDRTQYYFETYTYLTGTGDFQILLRPVVEETILDSGLVLTFSSPRGMRLDSAGKTLLQNPNYQFVRDSLIFITIYNEEEFLQVTVGCDTVVRRTTSKMASDDIVFTTSQGSELTIRNPEWYKIKFHEGDEVYIISEEPKKRSVIFK